MALAVTIPAMRTINMPDFEGNRLQENVQRVMDLNSVTVNTISAISILDGVLVSPVTLAGGSVQNLVPHTLGRAWKGWFLADIRGTAAGLIAFNPASYDTSKFIDIRFTTAGNVQMGFWIF